MTRTAKRYLVSAVIAIGAMATAFSVVVLRSAEKVRRADAPVSPPAAAASSARAPAAPQETRRR